MLPKMLTSAWGSFHAPPLRSHVRALDNEGRGFKDEWDSPCTQGVHGLAKQRPHAKLIILTNTPGPVIVL